MPKSGLDITIDDREVYDMINTLIRRIDNPQPLLKTIGRYIRALTKQMFVGKRPDTSTVRGEKWDKLAESTLNNKKQLRAKGLMIGNPARPLVRTGKLKDDLLSERAIKIKGKGLEYGTERKSNKGFPYPGIHQIGGKNLPARRWLFLTKSELNQIAHSTKDFILGKLNELRA